MYDSFCIMLIIFINSELYMCKKKRSIANCFSFLTLYEYYNVHDFKCYIVNIYVIH